MEGIRTTTKMTIHKIPTVKVTTLTKSHKVKKTPIVRMTTTIIENIITIIMIMKISQMINRFILIKMMILIWIKGEVDQKDRKIKRQSLKKLFKVIK